MLDSEYFNVFRKRSSQTYVLVVCKYIVRRLMLMNSSSYSTEFSQRVCNEYMKFLNFEGYAIDEALRYFVYFKISIVYCIIALAVVEYPLIKKPF